MERELQPRILPIFLTVFTEPMFPEILPRVAVVSDFLLSRKILEDHGGKVWATSR